MGRIVGGTGRVVAGATLDARAEAASALADARVEAEAIRAGAREAFDQAVREGREQGRAEAAAALAALLADARVQATRARETSAPAAIALALKMAKQIVGRAVALAPDVMAEIAGAALEGCRPRGDWVRVRVHPADVAAVAARRDALAARAPAGAALDIVADDAVGRHGCIIETALGQVDARLETQLAALERALLEETNG
jgi:flagellar biosynthesis/type III secretory pathway protein FliH